MEEYFTSFGKVVILNNNLVELILDKDIVFDRKKVVECHEFLLKKLSTSFSVLVNKKDTYTFTSEAKKEFSNLPQIDVMAVIIDSEAVLMSVDTLMRINESNNSKIKLFKTRKQAIKWLEFYLKRVASA